jgi:hypothetical protein
MDRQQLKVIKRPTLRRAKAALRKLLISTTFVHCVCERLKNSTAPDTDFLRDMINESATVAAKSFIRAAEMGVTVVSRIFPYTATFSSSPEFQIVTQEMIDRANHELDQLPQDFWTRLKKDDTC